MRQMAVGSDPDSFDMSALKAALGGRGGGCQPPTHAAKEHAAREQSECAERDVGDDAAGAEACASSPGGGGGDKTGAAARAAATWRVEVPSDEKENLDPVDTTHALACCRGHCAGPAGPPAFPLAVSDMCFDTSLRLLPPGFRVQATGQYHGASHTPPQRGARPTRQPFTERPVKTATCFPPAPEREEGVERIPSSHTVMLAREELASLLTCCGEQVPQSSSSGQNGNLAGTTDAPRRKGLRALNPSRDASKSSMMR